MSSDRYAHVVCFYDVEGTARMEFNEDYEWLVSIYDPAVPSSLAAEQVQSVVGYFRTAGEHLERVKDAEIQAAVTKANAEANEFVTVSDPDVRPFTVRMHGPPGFSCTEGSWMEREHAQRYRVDDLPASLRPTIVLRDGVSGERMTDTDDQENQT